MHLNTIAPDAGATKTRQRRGRGGYLGKTGGRGHKGQKSRSGGKVRIGFQGGGTPLYRQLPKSGFVSRVSRVTADIRVYELNRIEGDRVDLASLRKAGLIQANICRIKIFAAGELKKALVIAAGIRVSAGAKQLIEAAGGRVEE